MHIEIPQVLVDEHVDRLRDAAQAPTTPFVRRFWAMIRRRQQPAPTPWIPRRSAARQNDRLAA
jgi:hypothetical protein